MVSDMWKVSASLILLVGLFTNQLHANDSNTHVLRFASPYGVNAPFSRADRAWMEMIEQRSNGRIRFEEYWNGSLIGRTHTVQELAAGVADIGVISPVLSRVGMHLTRGSLAFYDGSTNLETSEVLFAELWDRYPALHEEYAGLKVLAVNGLSPMYVMTADKPVRSLGDLEGLRLKATSDKVRPLGRLGVDAVAMPMSEAYFALHRGILDGAISPTDTIAALHFDEVIRYITLLPSPRPPMPSRAINESAWNSLPEDMRLLLSSTSEWWADKIVEETTAASRRGMDYAIKQGIEIIHPNEDDLSAFISVLASEGREVAGELDDRELPGTEILDYLTTRAGQLQQ